MDLLNPKKRTDVEIASGRLLIAEPFLGDPGFARSVVVLCEYSADGSVGFVLNRATSFTLGDLLSGTETPQLPVWQGGPVALDTLHMLHRCPQLLGGTEIAPGMFWGGSYDHLQEAIGNDTCNAADIRLFLGYSGWSPGQLDKELEEGSWLVGRLSATLLFDTAANDLWQHAVRGLGSDFAHILHMPTHPGLN